MQIQNERIIRSVDGIYGVRLPKDIQKPKYPTDPPKLVSKPSKRRFGSWKKVTLFGVGVLAVYLCIAPFLPNIEYNIGFKPILNSSASLREIGNSVALNQYVAKDQTKNGNWLVIPKIGVEVEIFDGNSEKALRDGVWHDKGTSTPELGSNTVISGHRFQYFEGAKTFYHLDKLAAGDEIDLYWKGKTYKYKVSNSRVVPPTDVNILSASTQAQITLYTCTPVWKATDRLVVTAKLM